MKTLIISAFAAAALATAASTANAFNARLMCTSNGTQLTGVASKGALAQPVSAVILPSGEVVGLR